MASSERHDPMPWETIVGIATQVGEVSGRVDMLVGNVTELAKTVASHDAADQERHLDLIKAGEERQKAISKHIAASQKEVMAAITALSTRLDTVQSAQQADAAVLATAAQQTALQAQLDTAQPGTVEAARTVGAFLLAVPLPVWVGGASFVAAVIAALMGVPFQWPEPHPFGHQLDPQSPPTADAPPAEPEAPTVP